MQDFFEFLESRGLGADSLDQRIGHWKRSEIHAVAEQCDEFLPDVAVHSNSNFTFIANASLSGTTAPCAGVNCRLTHIDNLARFAALYADKVLLQNSFLRYPFPRHAPLDEIRDEFINDLRVLYHIRPLLEQGLVSVVPARNCWCRNCAENLSDDPEQFSSALAAAEGALASEFTSRTGLVIDSQDDSIRFTGPSHLLEHGSITFRLHRFLKSLEAEAIHVEPSELEATIQDRVAKHSFAGPIIRDVLLQNVYSSLYGYSYLTDRSIDTEILRTVNDKRADSISRAALGALEHSLPFIGTVGIDRVLELRRQEGESFRVYRDALRSVLRNIGDADQPRIKEAFNDVVLPELNRIDLAIRNSRSLLRDRLLGDPVIDVGLIAVGLFSGFLNPSLPAITAAVGGFAFARDIARNVRDALKEPSEARDSSYFFLWKLRSQASSE